MHKDFVNWFRGASPYIHAHRGGTFVVQFGGEALETAHFAHLMHDLALLNTLGIHLVVVHGIRPQIGQRLGAQGIPARFHRGLRVTDDPALAAAKEAAGSVRVEIEAVLSMGLANSPMAGARIRVTSGNYITARPLGVRDGIDFCHTGEVRRVDGAGIAAQLGLGNVVLVSPIGYSPTGEAFNLSAEEVATGIAIELGADKLLLLGRPSDLRDRAGHLLRQLTLDEARRLLSSLEGPGEDQEPETLRQLHSAIHACYNNVTRVHLLDREQDGVLLMELFTRDGVGIMVSADTYERTRRARIDDVGGVLELIEPLETEGILVRRPREKLEQEIEHFTVVERDGTIIACAALYPTADPNTMELACLAVHPEYRNRGLGEALLEHLENSAVVAGRARLFVLTTRTAQWFEERGFGKADIEKLPVDRLDTYNYQRNSRVLVKTLET